MKKKSIYRCILVSLFLVTACGTPLEEYQAKNEQENEIKATLVEFTNARNEYDVGKMATFLTDDCRIDIQGYAPLGSKSEWLSAWKDSDMEAIGKCKFKNLELSINDEYAEAKTDGSLGVIARDIKFEFKLVRQNDLWMISELTNYLDR